MANLTRKAPRVLSLSLRCGCCGCRFSALSWGVRSATLVGCPSCGRFWSVPAQRFLSSGALFAWVPGALPALPAPALPPLQLALFG